MSVKMGSIFYVYLYDRKIDNKAILIYLYDVCLNFEDAKTILQRPWSIGENSQMEEDFSHKFVSYKIRIIVPTLRHSTKCMFPNAQTPLLPLKQNEVLVMDTFANYKLIICQLVLEVWNVFNARNVF